ncbi:glycophorin-A [Glossophaga mutica]
MYRNIIIGLLLSGSISSVVLSQQEVTSPKISDTTVETGLVATESRLADWKGTEQLVTRSQPVTGQGQTEARRQIEHIFSEPVIIVIIFGVMAVIVMVILFFAYVIGKLSKRSQGNVQPAFPQNTDDPLSSVETENPVLPQNNNE